MGCDERGIPAFALCKETATMANGPGWNGISGYRVDPAANAAMQRRMHNARMREIRLRREETARLALSEIEAARFARLPWPVRAIDSAREESYLENADIAGDRSSGAVGLRIRVVLVLRFVGGEIELELMSSSIAVNGD